MCLGCLYVFFLIEETLRSYFGVLSGIGLSTDKTEASEASRVRVRTAPTGLRSSSRHWIVLVGFFCRGSGGRTGGPPRRWFAGCFDEEEGVHSTSQARVVVYLISNRRLSEKLL